MCWSTNGSNRSSRTASCATSSPPTATAPCCASPTADSVCATQTDSAAARMPFLIAWKHIWPARSCPNGRCGASRSLNRTTQEANTHDTQRFRHRRARIGDRIPLGVRTYRHTGQAVAAGASEAGAEVAMVAVDLIRDADWDTLDAADGIIFGSATYMGNVSAAFQSFAEKTG